MSLTSIISSHHELKKEFPNLKQFVHDQKELTLTKKEWGTAIKVPSIGKSFEQGLIGTAFDYAARCIVIKTLGYENVVKENLLIAEKGLSCYNECAEMMQLFPTGSDEIDKERDEGLRLVWDSPKEIIDYLKGRLNNAKRSRENYIEGKCDLKTMVEGTVFLARLDEVYRARSINVVDEYFLETKGKTYFSQYRTLTTEAMVENVCEMSILFNTWFNSIENKNAILNPTFGDFSKIVGGADADMIIDGVLIDLKTRNKLCYVGDDFAQLFGYAAMAQKIGMNLKAVGIYHARFGVFASVRLDTPLLPLEFLDNYLKKIIQIAKVT